MIYIGCAFVRLRTSERSLSVSRPELYVVRSPIGYADFVLNLQFKYRQGE